jgi:hypothetical protein
MFYNQNNIQGNQCFDVFTAICKRIDRLSQAEFEILERTLTVYQKNLSDYNISDKSLLLSNNQRALKQFWFVIFLTPLALLGKLIWWLPGRLSIWIANKTVTRIDFYTSVLSGIMGVLGVLWWILLISVFYLYLGRELVPLALILPLFCYIYMQWKERQADFFALLRVRKMKQSDPERIVDLFEQRNKIMN